MPQEFDNLIKAFDKAIKNRDGDKFGMDDINAIYDAASKVFDVGRDLPQNQIDKIRDKWVELAEGKINKSGATKKLQGTSRAEAIRSVLKNML